MTDSFAFALLLFFFVESGILNLAFPGTQPYCCRDWPSFDLRRLQTHRAGVCQVSSSLETLHIAALVPMYMSRGRCSLSATEAAY